MADCVEKDWFENGQNIKTFQKWKDETEVESGNEESFGDEYTWKYGVEGHKFIVDLPHDNIC